MQRANRWMAVVLLAPVVQLSACGGGTAEAAAKIAPARVEHIEGSELSRVTLTAKAAERLDIQTAVVGEARVAGPRGGGALRKIIPYSAVLYDAHGETWVYTSPAPLVFVRHVIRVDYIAGDRVILSEGPPAGTTVVTVGAAELFGAEFEIGH